MFNKKVSRNFSQHKKKELSGNLIECSFVFVLVAVVFVKALHWIVEHGIYKTFITSVSWVRR